jgi:F0F1-type ATP synthase assembly protein I
MLEEKKEQAPWWQPGLILFSKLSTWIAIPILLALFAGKYLDKKFGTEPWLFLSLTGLSFLVSTAGLVFEASKAMKRIEEQEEQKKKEASSIAENKLK